MKKPLIGITPNYNANTKEYQIHEDYANAVLHAGGIPVLLFPETGFPDYVDAIILSGGGDIDPLLFGEEFLHCVTITNWNFANKHYKHHYPY